MQTTFTTARWPLMVGILLIFPAFYLLTSTWLFNSLGISLPRQIVAPWLDPPCINGHFSFNINMLFIFGPVIAIVVNLRNLFVLYVLSSEEQLDVSASINKYSWSWIVVIVAMFCLAATGIHLITGNCC